VKANGKNRAGARVIGRGHFFTLKETQASPIAFFAYDVPRPCATGCERQGRLRAIGGRYRLMMNMSCSLNFGLNQTEALAGGNNSCSKSAGDGR